MIAAHVSARSADLRIFGSCRTNLRSTAVHAKVEFGPPSWSARHTIAEQVKKPPGECGVVLARQYQRDLIAFGGGE